MTGSESMPVHLFRHDARSMLVSQGEGVTRPDTLGTEPKMKFNLYWGRRQTLRGRAKNVLGRKSLFPSVLWLNLGSGGMARLSWQRSWYCSQSASTVPCLCPGLCTSTELWNCLQVWGPPPAPPPHAPVTLPWEGCSRLTLRYNCSRQMFT